MYTVAQAVEAIMLAQVTEDAERSALQFDLGGLKFVARSALSYITQDYEATSIKNTRYMNMDYLSELAVVFGYKH
jgi:predicted fused transcriptional regulator/phosphomethylpyrimidine kinase